MKYVLTTTVLSVSISNAIFNEYYTLRSLLFILLFKYPKKKLFFRRVEYLRRTGNREEVAKYSNAAPELIAAMEQCARDGSFRQWKRKVTAI